MDVLYVIGNSSQWGNHEELRYSIRSFQKHYKDLGKVFVVGHRPLWLQNVIHIPAEDPYASTETNIVSKILLGCISDISEDFIFSADDYILLQDVTD